jgi:hypothetical protein
MDRLVIVPASAVADVVDLVERALPDLDAALADALSGSVANLVSVGVLEPALEPVPA